MARNKTLLTIGAALTAAVTICTIGTANADIAPSAGDAVGIGSDTVQNIGNFLADGDNQGNPGYNASGPKNRLVSFDATPDGNDRAGYAQGSTAAAPKPLNPTIVLRQGLQPVQRPNGSGAGVAALIADGTAHNIDFVRMSRLPKVSEQNNGIAGVGPLRVIKISTDALGLAVSAVTTLNGVSTGVATHAPLGGTSLTAAQIVSIYQCSTGFTNWSSLGGTAGTIVPQIPQSGSGTGDTFRADLQALNGGTAVTLGGCVQTVEENDSTSLNTNPDAIAPFSAGRKSLFDIGYFNNPANKYGTPQTQLTSGVQFTASTTYTDTRNLYVVFRDSDKTSTTKFQPGSSVNYVQDLFLGANPYVASGAGAADIAAAGATPAYKDCGAGAGVTTC